MKKFLSWLLVLCMLCSLLPSAVFSASAAVYSGDCGREGDDVRWSYNSDTYTLTISGNGYMRDYDSCAVEYDPNFTGNYATRPWEDFIFEIQKVIVSDGVKNIGCRAFLWGEEITYVSLPESLKWIGENAFAECYALPYLALPSGIESIGVCAFSNCYALKEVVLPASLTMISSDMFCCCESLTTLYIGSNVTYVDDSAFVGCTALEDVYYSGDESSWNSIELGSENEDLTSATIHYGFRFGTCGWAHDNVIWRYDPDTCTLTVFGSGMMYQYGQESTPWDDFAHEIKRVVIERGVTVVGPYAFRGCTALREVTLSDSITYLGDYCFADCSSLASVTIPGNVTTIREAAFVGCQSLQEVTIQDGVTSLSECLFEDCPNLSKVYLPVSLTETGDGAFAGCESFSVYYAGDEAQWNAVSKLGTSETELERATVYYLAKEGNSYGTCGAEGDNLTWTFDPTTGTLTIAGYGDMKDYESGEVPWWKYRQDIHHVHIGNNVTSLCDAAFDCVGITEIILPDSLTVLGNHVFDSTALMNVTVPGSIVELGDLIFLDCDVMESAAIEEGVPYLSRGMFSGCLSLTSVHIPVSVTEIRDIAFTSCPSIQEVYYAGTEEQWNAITIGTNNEDLTGATIYFNAKEGNVYGTCGAEGNNLTWTFDPTTGTLTIAGCGDMKDYEEDEVPWRDYMQSLNHVHIGKNVTSLTDNAFDNASIREITIPNSLTSLGSFVFDTAHLEKITVPGSIVELGEHIFLDCDVMESATIEEGVPYLSSGMFSGCLSLATVHIPVSVTEIRDSAFASCSSLQEVYYAGTEEQWNAITIDAYNEDLTGATIYFNAKEGNVYGTCGAEGNNLTWAFDPETGTLTISGSGAMADYSEGTAPWAGHADEITSVVMDETITTIGAYAFYGCTALEEITLHEGLTKLGRESFYNCDSLTSVTVPGSVNSMGKFVFQYCDNLESATIKDGVTAVGVCMFYDCAKLTTVKLPASITSVQDSAFSGCDSLSDVYYAGSESQWNEIEFQNGNNELLDATIHFNAVEDPYSGSCGAEGDNLTWTFDPETGTLTISGSGAMADYSEGTAPWAGHADEITSVVMDETITTIGAYAFYGCTALEEITLHDGIAKLGRESFYNCDSLISVTVPGSVDSIGKLVFENCNNLETVTIKDGVTEVGVSMFNYCDKLTTIRLPASITSVLDSAFNGCDSLSDVYYAGSESQWNEINFQNGNNELLDATIHFNAVEDPYSGSCGAEGDNLTWTFDPETGTLTVSGNGAMADYSSDLSDIPWAEYFADIQNLVIEEGVTSIGASAFADCGLLKEVELPGTVERIGSGAFNDCYELQSLTIPASVTAIDDNAFAHTDLQTVYYEGTEEQWNAIDRDNNSVLNSTTVYVNAKEGNVYGTCGAEGDNLTWTFDPTTGALTVSGSGDMADHPDFGTNCDILSLTIGENVTSIGEMAFHCACKLKEATIPDSVTSMGEDAFSFCSMLEIVRIGTGLTELPRYAFYNCDSLVAIILPENVSTIGPDALKFLGNQSHVLYGGTEEKWNSMVAATTGDVNVQTVHCETAGDEIYVVGNEGYECLYCSICDTFLTNNSCNHAEATVSNTVAASCTSEGYSVYSCPTCGVSYTGDRVEALGHDVSYTNSGENHTVGCSRCNYSGKEVHEYVYTNNGENHTVGCSKCDYSATEDHTYTDGSCICGAEEVTGPIPASELVYMSKALSLQSYIAFDCYVTYAALEGYDSWYVVFERYDYAKDTTVTETVSGEDFVGFAVRFEYKVNSYQMSDTINATIYAVKDGKTYVGETYTNSVSGYVNENIVNASSDAHATVYANLVTYGAKAQVYMKYNVENLADAGLGEYASYVTTTVPTAESVFAQTNNGLNGAQLASINLGISAAVEIQTTITLSEGYSLQNIYGEMVFVDSSGKTVTQRVEGTEFDDYGVMFIGRFNAMTAVDGRVPVEITIYDLEGNAISETWTYSVASYLDGTTLTGDALAVLHALVNYYDSAAAFF